MGSKTFDFLTESFLFKDNLIDNQYRQISEQEILNELNKYREFCLANVSELENEVLASPSNLKVVSGIERPPLNLMKQSAFYIEQYIINDPIFSFGYKSNSFTTSMNSYLSLDVASINKIELAAAIQYTKSLTPFVAADYVKLLPVNYFLEPPEQLPILFSENLFSDLLSKDLADYFSENIIINSVERIPENPELIRLGDLHPCREILFRFKNHTDQCYGYNLFESEFEFIDKEQGKFNAKMRLPNEVPEREYFLNWVNQSFNLSCKQLYDEVLWRNLVANRFEASYLSESSFVFDLLNQIFPLKDEIELNTANTLLNIELPFLHEVEASTLMSIRLNEGEAFQNFRVHLDKQFRDLRLVKDPNELKVKADNALHELRVVQIQAINQKLNSIKKVSALDTIVLIGGLLASIQSVQSGAWSLAGFSAAVGVARGLKPFIDYSSQVKLNPAFFLWKVLKESSS
jgi:hypothetical protein